MTGHDSPLTFNIAGSLSGDFFSVNSDGGHGTDLTLVSGVQSFSGGTTNYSDNDDVGYQGPQISNNNSTLTLTDDRTGEYGSWFNNNTYSISSFTASFDYQATGQQNATWADGMAFVLQNDPRGSSALGTDFYDNGGSGLGYTGISPSAAVEFNIYDGHTPGTNFATNGSTGNYNSTLPVDFWDTGDTIQVVLSYNGSVLTETLTDLVNGNTFSTSYGNVNLSETLDSETAYVGFTAGTGDSASTQTVSNFTFESDLPASWAGASGDDWTTAGDWTDGDGHPISTPNSSDAVVFDTGGFVTITSADTAGTVTVNALGIDIEDETGGSLTVTGALTMNGGTFNLIGGTLSASSVEIGSSGLFIGYGTVQAPLDNANWVEAEASTTLSLLGPVTGTGNFQIDNAATLEFGNSVTSGFTSCLLRDLTR